MLIQFNFSNFKSYRDEVSLDMTSTLIKEHPYNVISYLNNEEYIRVAAIHGSNASGKSGVIEAFHSMKSLVLNSFKKESEGKGIPVKRFAFDKQSRTGTAEFEVFFSNRNKEYQYGFKVDNKKVHDEWLYRRDFRGKNKFVPLFKRNSNEIICGPILSDAEKFIDVVEESTLFLSIISNAKIDEAKNVYDWFQETYVVDFSDSFFEAIVSKLLISHLKNEKYRQGLEKFLKAIDVGIDGIRVEELKDTIDENSKPIFKVYSRHKTIDNETYVEIPFSEESGGTNKMFCLYYFLVNCLKTGNTLFVDELDAKLHPLLLRYIINLFHNPDINKNNAQLVFTTHADFTLTKETFRRDQIWFTEKDYDGISNLYSLAEYKIDNKKVRNDATYNKDYLSGRYGAIPLLQDFNLLED